jgi:MraZ protein
VNNVSRGVQHLNLDVKGRMTMPSRHRDALVSSDNGCLVATFDIHVRCILIYPLTIWERMEKELQKIPAVDPKVRSLQRFILGNATDLEIDANGRILLTAPLRKYANLDKAVVLVSKGDRFELWNEDSWMAENDKIIEHANSGDLVIPEEMQHLIL